RKFYINGEANPGSTGKSAAASTNKMYVAPTDKTDLYYETMASSCSQGTIASGYSSGQLGSAIANDEAGNIVFHAGEYWASGTPTKFTIIPAGATGMSGKKEITITSPGARCDYIRATGNLLSGTGYIWFAVNGTKKVVAAKVTNGAFVSNTTYTVNGMTNNFNSVCTAYMYGSNKMFIHNNADSKMYDCTVSGTTVTATAISKTAAVVEVTGDYWQMLVGNIMFELRGHKILVRSNATVNQGTQFSVIDMTAGTALHDNYATWGSSTTTGIGAAGVWPTILKEDDNNVAIYVYCPTHGFGKYLVTATPAAVTLPTAPVKNLTAVVDENNVASVSWSVPDYDSSTATLTGYTVTVGSGSPVTITDTSYSIGEISSSVTVSVVPNYALISDPSTTGSGDVSSVTVKPAGLVGPPRNTSIITYDGRSIVEFSWHAPEDTFDKPTGYNVYRDGVLIASNITEMILIDSNVSEGRHEYTVASVYSGTEYPNCTAGANITVQPFNTANNVYKIEELYDYGIGTDVAASGTGFEGLDHRDNSRQGVVYDGKWYIATGAHQNSTTAGIIVFDIEDPRTGGTKLNLNPAIKIGQTAGIGMDDAGNIFVRGMHPSYPDSKYNAGTGLVKGVVYKRNADGTYANGLEVDLSALGIAATYATGVGRYDYYYLDGNIFSSAGAKLPIAAQQPTNGKNYSCVTLKGSGSTVTATINFSVATTDPFTATGAESYAFPNIETPGEYIVQARSTAYAVFESGATTGKATLYSGETTCNNSGGTMIKWGSDLLLITPYSMYSANNGSFRVAIAHNGDLDNLVPLLNINQPATNVSVNSNGLWMYAEESVADECVYLYEYVPGTRFAKYKITRSGTYSFPEPEIQLVPKFGPSDNNTTGDLACYDANLSWERPKTSTGEYWPADGDNPLTKYIVSVVDKNDNPYADADGTVYNNYEVTAANTPTFAESTVELPMMKDFDDNEPYTIKVKAVYDFSGTDKESFERTATSRYTYPPNAPALTVVHNVARNVDFNQAWNASGENILVQEKFDIYRINIQLHNPEPVTSGDYTIPVSYYSLEVNKGDGNGWQPVQDYPQYVATDGYSVGPDGKTEVSTYGDHIAGDADLDDVSYEFYYFISHGRTYGPLRAVGDASDEDPSQWQYRLTANYGSSESVSYDGETYNPLSKGLAKSAYGEAVPSEEVTSVEFIQDCGSLRAYPIPTEGVLNIKSPIEITSIEFYSVSGALVKRVKGNGNNDATIDVSDLAAGTYIVSINGSMSLTIVKK
ncbi:MAG: T9SS type A sorting domain-containing protein, partial [Muribaculaceae bacterium]|nr:T9SS type A sorting domain-containing protein [Muribaculaceae bacterium]